MFNRYSLVVSLVSFVLLSVQLHSQRLPIICAAIQEPCQTKIVPYFYETPPYTFGMPVEVLYTYVAIDSICKLNAEDIESLMDVFMDTISVNEMRLLNTYLYKCIDYNPILFYRYINYSWYLKEDYISKPSRLFDAYSYNTHNRIGVRGMENFLLLSSGIFLVEIADITVDSSFNKYKNDPDSLENYVCITAKVLEPIKGAALCSTVNHGEGESEDYIKYSYKRGTCTFTEWDQRMGPQICAIYEDDSIGVDTNGDTMYQTKLSDSSNLFCVVHKPNVGDRYIVFLDMHAYPCIVPSGIPYIVHPMIMYQREGGLFRIQNGVFYDQNNFFGQGNEVDVSSFVSWLKLYIQNTF